MDSKAHMVGPIFSLPSRTVTPENFARVEAHGSEAQLCRQGLHCVENAWLEGEPLSKRHGRGTGFREMSIHVCLCIFQKAISSCTLSTGVRSVLVITKTFRS